MQSGNYETSVKLTEVSGGFNILDPFLNFEISCPNMPVSSLTRSDAKCSMTHELMHIDAFVNYPLY
jgi:hypothetical protein